MEKLRKIKAELEKMHKYEEKRNIYVHSCQADRYKTPVERNERKQGFLSGLLTAISLIDKELKEYEHEKEFESTIGG